ncbi:MAG: hypothetical protein HND51_16190 [Chloroflexi bacterium]|nr:hypothetical protein [Chloroflexota bacterium]
MRQRWKNYEIGTKVAIIASGVVLFVGLLSCGATLGAPVIAWLLNNSSPQPIATATRPPTIATPTRTTRPPNPTSTNVPAFPLSGSWEGTITSLDGTFSTFLVMDIDDTCDLGTICGNFDTPDLGCTGDLELARQSGDKYYFLEINITGHDDCVTGFVQRLSLNQNENLQYELGNSPTDFEVHTTGTLFQQ